ncbi:MAG: DUF177 domain-containing protein [Chloroflexi bacterium]|nr:DUF177 domain-containing protein [Ktedonobacteraceae bacterium]MBV9021968.1 DUF177 domain-containing protein [Ktedonobacteraceae bacterium]MBV9707848.1 DUF177 domain-containing protein [Chloroflexota bacterium]
MIFNVAQLLKAPVGTSSEADIHEEHIQLDDDFRVIRPLIGHVRMRRTNQCILVDGWIDVTLESICTRCLKQFEQPLRVSFEERFYPSVDVVTGVPLPPVDEEEVFPIDEHHQLDLTEAVRQHMLLHIPMVTLCDENCAGLCAQCGHDLNQGPCNCEPAVDERLNVLKTLLQ